MRRRGAEDISPQKRRRGFGVYFLASAVALLCAQGIFYLLLLDSTVGRFSFLKKQPPPDPSLVRDFRVVVLKSESTAVLNAENPNSYYRRERYWEDVLRAVDVPFHVVSDRELPGALQEASALVLPGVSCMGPQQRAAIRQFLRQGKGVVASGPLGARAANCAWQGWDFLTELVGARGVANVNRAGTTYAALAGQLPFSAKVPAGYLLSLPSQELTLVSAPKPDALLTDWRLRDVTSSDANLSGLAAHNTWQGGRVVWFGFSEALATERADAQQTFDAYALAAVRWAARQPLAYLADWPDQKRAAVIVVESVHASYSNGEKNAVLLKQKQVPATFVLSSSEAVLHPGALQAFQAAGEIASAGDTYDAFGGQTTFQQADRLVRARETLDKVLEASVVGFAAPFGTADNATVLALNDSGYRYYLNEVAVSRAVPEIIEFPSQSRMFPLQKREVSRVFRTGSDDVELIANYRGPSPPTSELADSFLVEFRRIANLGGVYSLYFHDYLLGAAEYQATLNRVLDGIKSEPVWTVSGRDLARWWQARQKVQVIVKKLSPHRLQLDVASMADDTLDHVSVSVYLPYHPNKVEIRSTLFRLQPPRFQLSEKDDLLRMYIPTLKGQTDYNFIISLDE